MTATIEDESSGNVPGVATARTADEVIADLEALAPTLEEKAALHDLEGSFPHEAFQPLHDIGVLQLTLPTAFGGSGSGLYDSARALQLLGRADPSVGLVVMWHLLHHQQLSSPDNSWPVEIREEVQRSAAQAPSLINALRVEPELGTPARGGLPATTARLSADAKSWNISGHKIYCTGIPALRWFTVWARTDEEDPLVGAFLVDSESSNWRIVETWDHLGLRASGSHDVLFDEVIIPVENAVAVARFGSQEPRRTNSTFAWASVLQAALYSGVLAGALEWLVQYLNERTPTNLGAPLSSLPRFQLTVGRIDSLLHTNETLIRETAREVDSNGNPGVVGRAPLVKHISVTNAIEAIDLALQLTGNPGLMRRNPLERHHRDALTGRVHTPQSDSVLTNAGPVAFGLPPNPFG
jgi:alkylation response protein AidB-like acyl-CoA dehydrogenase